MRHAHQLDLAPRSLLLQALLALALPACFDATLEGLRGGVLACSAARECPRGLSCACDDRCWREGEGPGADCALQDLASGAGDYGGVPADAAAGLDLVVLDGAGGYDGAVDRAAPDLTRAPDDAPPPPADLARPLDLAPPPADLAPPPADLAPPPPDLAPPPPDFAPPPPDLDDGCHGACGKGALCVAGVCVCNPRSCGGCCQGNVCLPGTGGAACGSQGAACVSCALRSEGTACRLAAGAWGCGCTVAADCPVANGAPQACATKAGLCGARCTMGDAGPCNGGCCSSKHTCSAGDQLKACGHNGGACQECRIACLNLQCL